MAKVDIISGFLGAGKTTLIKKLINESLSHEKVVLIENEFGEIGIDGSFLKEAGVEITEMNSGCICCSLVGDFTEALKKVIHDYHPDRIIIEPSGVGKLSDVIQAVTNVHSEEIHLNSFVTVIDVKKCKIYSQNFGEFFNNQIQYASSLILSRTQDVTEEKIQEAIDIIRQLNTKANIITTPWQDLSADTILSAFENKESLEDILLNEVKNNSIHHKHHHGCDCDHEHHEHNHDCGCHHEHHHEHHHDCGCEHHHDHDHDCDCYHEHHADEVFSSIGKETIHTYTQTQLESILEKLSSSKEFGDILRAKGILQTPEKKWINFDLVPGEYEIRDGQPDYTGRLCIIGKDLKEKEIFELFGVN